MGSGSCLSSHAVSSTVLSVYVGLTSVFGMRTGGTPQLNHRKLLVPLSWEKCFDRLRIFPSLSREKRFDLLRIFPFLAGKNASTCFAFFLLWPGKTLRLAPHFPSASLRLGISAFPLPLPPGRFRFPFRKHHSTLTTAYQVNSLRSSPRPISIAQLRTLLHFHLRPINHVVFMGSYSLRMGDRPQVEVQ